MLILKYQVKYKDKNSMIIITNYYLHFTGFVLLRIVFKSVNRKSCNFHRKKSVMLDLDNAWLDNDLIFSTKRKKICPSFYF